MPEEKPPGSVGDHHVCPWRLAVVVWLALLAVTYVLSVTLLPPGQ